MSDAFLAGVLDPRGPVGHATRLILLDATLIMLAIVIPVICLTVGFAWWFRAGNAHARRRPDWVYSGRVEFVTWSIPALVVLFLGGIAWIGSHTLEPSRPLSGNDSVPLKIQVVSLDWKWLFIYPEQRIATVNSLVIPAGVPVHFQLTSASVMNSFFVPQLGSQIYTMAGMTTQLHLQADEPGNYAGFSAQFSGEGFSDMRFSVQAVSQAQFDPWVSTVKEGGNSLGAAEYARLAIPSVNTGVATFSSVDAGLFGAVAHHGQVMPAGDR